MKATDYVKLILCGLVLFFASAAHSTIFVVGAKNFPDNQLSVEIVKEAFLGRQPRILDGGVVRAIDRNENANKMRATFLKQLLGWNPTRYKAYWAQIIFTGRGESLAIAQNKEDLVQQLKGNERTISFIDNSEKSEELKVLLTLD